MTFSAYTNPDFGPIQKLIFFVISLIAVLFCILLISLTVKAFHDRRSEITREYSFRIHLQLFYEMIIAGTSVMTFSCLYVVLNHIYTITGGQAEHHLYSVLMNTWANGRDFVLLILICMSCVINTLLDKFIIPLKLINKEEKASMRMLGMFYVILILIFLNVIGDESEYSPVMMYYFGLMVGRFVYFDASFMDFIGAIKNAFMNLPLLLLTLLLSSGLCFFGFKVGYLLERNYYIVGIFYTHLFLLLCIFIIHNSHVMDIIVKKPGSEE